MRSAIMSLLDRLLQRKADTLPIVPTDLGQWWRYPGSINAHWSDVTPGQMLDYYVSNPIVHACVRVVADAFSQARMKVFKPGTDEKIERHPLYDLIRRP